MPTNCHDCKYCVRILFNNSRHESAEVCAPISCGELSQPISTIGDGNGSFPLGTSLSGGDCPLFEKDGES